MIEIPLLFFVTSPGVIFTMPPGDSTYYEFIITTVAHAIIFTWAVLLFTKYVKVFVAEGFQDKDVEGWQLGSSCGTEYCRAPKIYCKENDAGVKYCSEG
jgi:hypothetical protein